MCVSASTFDTAICRLLAGVCFMLLPLATALSLQTSQCAGKAIKSCVRDSGLQAKQYNAGSVGSAIHMDMSSMHAVVVPCSILQIVCAAYLHQGQGV